LTFFTPPSVPADGGGRLLNTLSHPFFYLGQIPCDRPCPDLNGGRELPELNEVVNV